MNRLRTALLLTLSGTLLACSGVTDQNPQRALRTEDFLYIRNFAPDRWPMGMPPGPPGIPEFADMDLGPTKAWLLSNEDAAPALYEHAFGKRPAEELYDLGVDPDQLGPVNTTWPDYVTFQVWNLPKLNTNALRRICHYSAETSGFLTAKCSTPSCMSPNRDASGAGCRPGLETGTPSTPE